jgi:hypothetical protein
MRPGVESSNLDFTYGKLKGVKAPRLRVTKWLAEIPVEAECSLCSGVPFKAAGAGHRPNKVEYAANLQRQFDEHVRTRHSAQGESSQEAENVRKAKHEIPCPDQEVETRD